MCQINNIQKIFAAGTICYKVLYYGPYGYISIYQRTSWKLGQIRTTDLYNYKLSSNKTEHYFRCIGSGFFHAFPTLEEAKRFQRSFCEERFSNSIYANIVIKFPIAEMRIPEDVEGFSGIYLDYAKYFDSIAVPILEFIKIVD